MAEKCRELKVTYAALVIIAAQTLGIDITALSSLAGAETEILDTIRSANAGDGGMWAAVLAGVYALARSYVKGRLGD